MTDRLKEIRERQDSRNAKLTEYAERFNGLTVEWLAGSLLSILVDSSNDCNELLTMIDEHQ